MDFIDGGIYRLEKAAHVEKVSDFPRKLSETGVETIWSRRLPDDFWWNDRLQPKPVRQKSRDF